MQLFRLTILAVLASAPAGADEGLYPLAAGGDWVAVAHKDSLVAPPDVCVALALGGKVGFRADANYFQIRVMDNSWSLPPNVEGTVTISVGQWKQELDIDDNTANTVNITTTEPDISDLFDAMDKAITMTVTVGKAPPFNVSLAGSTRVTNAFRTCAGMQASPKGSGSNPFK
jgi:hypothetical protein